MGHWGGTWGYSNTTVGITCHLILYWQEHWRHSKPTRWDTWPQNMSYSASQIFVYIKNHNSRQKAKFKPLWTVKWCDEGWYSRDPLPVFSVGGHYEQFWHGQSILRCSLSSMSSTNHGVAHPLRCSEGWFGEAVVACDMPKPCKLPSLDTWDMNLNILH